jgi:ribosomal subunit interface protein
VQIPLQVSFQELDPSPAAQASIEERVEKLSRFHDRITNCRVVISSPHRHQTKGRQFSVKVDLSIPGRELVVNHDTVGGRDHEDVYAAIRDAFDAVQRQLQDHVEKTRDQRRSE